MALFPHTAEAHCVSVLPFRPANMLNKVLRFASSVSVLGLLFAQLGGCSSNEGSACGSNAECLTGQVCSSGSCVAPGAAGAAGGPSGSAGAMSSGGNGTPQGGAANVGTAGSSVGMAGSVSNGGSPSSGGQSQGGAQSNAGSSSGGSSSGGSGMAGSGGGSAGGPSVTVGQCKDDFWPAANNGSVTRYDFKQGTSLPACAYAITHTGNGSDGDWDTVEGISTGDGGYFGAMNTTDFAQGAACGACVEASYSGRKVVLTIVDECPIGTNPKCTKGHIDLSRKAIRQLEPNGSLEDVKGVNWKYVKCPAAGNAKVRLHPNQNPDWQPVVIENGLYPLKSVTLNGVNATRTGNNSGGNAWIANGKKAPYTVSATDVNNNAISFSYDGGSGLKDTGLQFKCQ
jgi:expansin (peptidoglycan-binding protein)